MTTYLDRLVTRTAATGSVLCVGLDPDPGASAGRLPADAGGDRALRLAARRGGAAACRGDQAEPRLLRGIRVAGMAALERDPGARPGRESRSSPTRSAATSARRRPDRRRPCSTRSGPMRSPSTRISASRRSPRCSSGPTASPTCCAGPRTRARASSRASTVDADEALAAPREPLWARVARRAATWGPGGTVGLVVGATAPDELAAIRATRARPRVPCPGRRRPGRDGRAGAGRGPRDGPAGRGQPGGGLLVNVSRGDRAGSGRAGPPVPPAATR